MPSQHVAAHQEYPITSLSDLEMRQTTPLEGQRHSKALCTGLLDRHPRIDLLHKDWKLEDWMVTNEKAILEGEIRVT